MATFTHDPTTERSNADAMPGPMTAEISNRIVHLMRETTGRGPTRARTYYGDDLVVCVVQDTLTPGERVLVDHGEGDAVLALRHRWQQVMREDAVAAVEEITGRGVIAFMSDNHVDPDVATETFILAPRTPE